MTYTLWIKEKNGEAAAWKFPTLYECFRCFNRLIGLYTNDYYNNSAHILDSDKNEVVTSRRFKKEFKKWYDTENKDKCFHINYSIDGRIYAIRTYQESKDEAIQFFENTFVKECVIDSIEELAM